MRHKALEWHGRKGRNQMTTVTFDNYLQILDPDTIRVRGTRIGIEIILDDYLDGASPEEIAARYRTLTLEQVYATITYYLHNQAEIDVYLQRWRAYVDRAWQEQEADSAEFVEKTL